MFFSNVSSTGSGNVSKELFLDYQFLDPDSECKMAINVGPIVQVRAGMLPRLLPTALWTFLDTCVDGGNNSQAVIGQAFAKRYQGRPKFSKPLTPLAFLQQLQDRFKGTDEWPGSPSSVNPPP
ncbi:hypothetical protein PsorP6_018236 [Peronosclerospora sorghi]|uniref:Uncharacterized protein n=1 Tax=Peronosclerospora sorghi TaxID=230839 RepID=A0ACC0WGK7_9STRA|nr:hypothetical protein PsorP6_018236 [Peronosclerospora sorghi]